MIDKTFNEEANQTNYTEYHKNGISNKVPLQWNFQLPKYFLKGEPFHKFYLGPFHSQIFYEKNLDDLLKNSQLGVNLDKICARLNNWEIFTIILGCKTRHDKCMVTPIGNFLDQKTKNQLISHFTNMVHVKNKQMEEQNYYSLHLQPNKQVYIQFIPVGQLYSQSSTQKTYRLIDGLFIVKIVLIPNLQRGYYNFTNTLNNRRLYICKYEYSEQKQQLRSAYVYSGLHTQLQFTDSINNRRRYYMSRYGPNNLRIQNRIPMIDVPKQTSNCSISHIYYKDKTITDDIQKQLRKYTTNVSITKYKDQVIQVCYGQTVASMNSINFKQSYHENKTIQVVSVSKLLLVSGLISPQTITQLNKYIKQQSDKDSSFKIRPQGQGDTLLIFNSLRLASLAGIFLQYKQYQISYQHHLIKHAK